MDVIKKLNNNVVLAKNEKCEEVILVGKGLGFQKIPYIISDMTIVEKIYVIPKHTKAYEMLDEIPTEIIELTEKIIRDGSKLLNNELNSTIFLGLADHINSAINRIRDGIEMNSPLQWEVKHMYPAEYKIGVEALKKINEYAGIELNSGEATFIALHFVNAQMAASDMTETTRITSIVGDIINIIRYYFKVTFDEESLNFARFVTHIRYFVMRQANNKILDDDNKYMYDIMKKKYTDELKCIEKIEKYLYDNYKWKCTDDEKLYLMLHIQRIRNNKN